MASSRSPRTRWKHNRNRGTSHHQEGKEEVAVLRVVLAAATAVALVLVVLASVT